MNSAIIHKGTRYTACHVAGIYECIAVTNNKTGKGVSLSADHPQFAEYMDALSTALDATEGDALCRAMIRG